MEVLYKNEIIQQSKTYSPQAHPLTIKEEDHSQQFLA